MTTFWPERTFGEIFEITSSKRVLQKEWKKSGIPFYRAREIVRLARSGHVENDLFISEAHYEKLKRDHGAPRPGDLMVSAVGTLGACYEVCQDDQFYFKDASVLQFRPNEDVDMGYIKHAFRTNAIQSQIHSGSGSTVGTYTISRAKETKIPLPPLPEQRRIAAILDKADELRQKRRQAIEKLDELLQSVFLEMFGDPVTNPKGRVAKLSEVCEKITDGTHQSPKWSTSGVPFLFQSNVQPRIISFETKKFISNETFVELTKRTPIEVGDVLYTIVGSYGNAAMVRESRDFCFQRHIAQLKPSLEVLPEYLEAAMNSRATKFQADNRVTGIAQKTLILRELRNIEIVVPSLQEQSKFKIILKQIEGQIAAAKVAMLNSEYLFSSLQQRAFNGTL
ncbi:MAG: restriction endonuclease subunit S [Zhongshania sp.]|jgi:type I restriction enzyme S subunit|nr:restriction endonuclease subunit S [Zhongshania sp.]